MSSSYQLQRRLWKPYLARYILTITHSLEAQKVVAKEVIDAYNVWDIERILAYRTPDCKQQILPATLNRSPKSNDEYRAYFETIEPLYINFTVRIILSQRRDRATDSSDYRPQSSKRRMTPRRTLVSYMHAVRRRRRSVRMGMNMHLS